MKTPLPTVEGLETRRFLSGYPMSAAMTYAELSAADDAKPAVVAKPAQAAAKAPAKKPAKPAKPPTLAGEWDGRWTVKAWPFKIKYDLDLEFYSISRDSKIAHGTLEIDGDDYSGRWTGVTLGKSGNFKYTLRKHGDKISIEGNVNPKSTFASGKITIEWDHGGKTKGDFSMSKWD
jgi:hypothetical protein